MMTRFLFLNWLIWYIPSLHQGLALFPIQGWEQGLGKRVGFDSWYCQHSEGTQ